MELSEKSLLCCVCSVIFGCLLCSGEWGPDLPVVYTVYNINKTWNEAKSICTARNSSMLSIPNDTIWKFWIFMLDPDISVAHRIPATYWFGLHSPNPSNLSQVYWDSCQIPKWKQYSPSYIFKDQCWILEIKKKIFNDVILNLWLAKRCSDKFKFICTWEKECIHQNCEEFIINVPSSQCSASCTSLHDNGEITDVANCKTRFIDISGHNFCHVYMDPSPTPGEVFSICYKPSLLNPLTTCSGVSPNPDVNTFIDTSTTPNSGCNSVTTLGTTVSNNMCECPCTVVKPVNSSLPQLTLAEKIEILKQELTINKDETSKNKRKHISAPDERPSARNLGAFGLSVLVLVPVCIILIDISSICRHIKMFSNGPTSKFIKDNSKNTTTKQSISRDVPNEDRNDYFSGTQNQLQAAEQFIDKNSIRKQLHNEVHTEQSSSVMCIRPKSSINPRIKVVYKDILDLKYQSSMIASRIVANDVRTGQRPLEQEHVFLKGNDIAESVKTVRKREKTEKIPWMRML